MDNFENKNEERDCDLDSDSSEGNDLLFQFIFGEKESTLHNQKRDHNEYRIRVDTDLKDPVRILLIIDVSNQYDRRRFSNKNRRSALKRKKLTNNLRKSFGNGIKGRPPKRLASSFDLNDSGPNNNKCKFRGKAGLKFIVKIYSSSIKLIIYVDICDLAYRCHVLNCEKIFTDSSSFRKHLITHGERQVRAPFYFKLFLFID